MSLDVEIEGFLHGEGVELVGFAPADAFDDWREVFEGRLRGGLLPAHYGDTMVMNPRKLMPEARSIVVYGVVGPGLAEVTDRERGSICGLAWTSRGERRIRAALAEFIENCGHRALAVTGIPQKAAAVRAGLAVQRKNTIAYFERGGSAVRIGTILTDAELSSTGGNEFVQCGECTACIDACPTGALLEGHVLDARRCLCYLLEYDSDFPRELWPAMGNRLLGCEECQLACPHDRDVPRLGLQDVEWLDLEAMAREALEDRAAQNSRFRDELCFPLYGEYTLARSIAIALGNQGTPGSVPLLEALARSNRPEVAEAARRALGPRSL